MEKLLWYYIQFTYNIISIKKKDGEKMIYTDEMIKQKNKQKEKQHKIQRMIAVPIMIVIFTLVFYIGYLKVIQKENDIHILGFRQYMVATGSMEPTYNVGDMIIIRETPKEEIKVGDIITYISENGIDTITHRVADIIEIDGQTYYKTKGDNNNSEDPELVNYSQVKGTIVFKISKLGTIMTKLLTGTGITILFAVIIVSYVRDKNKEDRIIARENARKLYNVPKYEENDSE